MTRPARLIVDPIACDGRGLCAELLPGLITLDDWGFPVISVSDVPAGLAGEVAAVVRLCPRLALRLNERPQPAGTKDRELWAPGSAPGRDRVSPQV